MNSKRLGIAVALAGGAVACGQGRAIFNVDIYSFLKGSVKDTVPYAAPPLTPNFTASNTPQKINLVPGLGSSGIDTVKVTGSADLRNQSGGPGTLRFQVYLASDSAGTYAAGRDSMFNPVPSGSVSGATTTPIVFGAPNLSPTGNALFTKSAIWVRIVATVSNPTATLLQGKAVLTGLQLRVVVQDKIF